VLHVHHKNQANSNENYSRQKPNKQLTVTYDDVAATTAIVAPQQQQLLRLTQTKLFI